jgi:hypothetical protein
LPEVPLHGLDHGPRVEPPRLRQSPIEGGNQTGLVLQEVRDPDRQDEIGEQGADQAARAGDQRQQERQVRATATPALADPGDDAVDPVADGDRDLQALVELAEPSELLLELRGEGREILDEGDQLIDQRLERQRQEFDDRDDAHDVDDEDGEGPPEAAADEPADRGIEEIDEQHAKDERTDAVARHPQDQAQDRRRQDEDGDAWRDGHEPAVLRAGGRIDERGRREQRDPVG